MNKLLENIIRNMVKEELNESVSDKVYHFTYPDPTLKILQTNEILLSPSYGIPADASLNYNKLYSLSLTTSPNAAIGFKGMDDPILLTRIEMNGRELNYNYKSKHVDYWQRSRDPKSYHSLRDITHSNEMEERILSDKDRIKPANRYITKIDTIVKNNKYFPTCLKLKQLADKFGIPCYFYGDAKSFNFSITKNAIDISEVPTDLDTFNYDSPSNDYAAIEFLSLVGYKDEQLKNAILAELKKFNVENAQEKIEKRTRELKNNYMHSISSVGNDDLTLSVQASIQNNRNTTDELTRYAIRMLGTDMRKQKCRTIKEYILYKIAKGKKPQKQYNQEFYQAIMNVIDTEYQNRIAHINQYSFNSVEGDYYDNNVTKFVPELKTELDKLIFKIKEHIKDYILNNKDMFQYSYVLSRDNMTSELGLKQINYAFASDIIDYQDSNLTPHDIENVISYVLYVIDDFYYPYVQNAQKQYQQEWYINKD